MYEKGEGVPQDLGIACRWYRKAAFYRIRDSEQKLIELDKWWKYQRILWLGQMKYGGPLALIPADALYNYISKLVEPRPTPKIIQLTEPQNSTNSSSNRTVTS